MKKKNNLGMEKRFALVVALDVSLSIFCLLSLNTGREIVIYKEQLLFKENNKYISDFYDNSICMKVMIP